MFANKQITKAERRPPIWWIDFICQLAVVLIVVAEGFSDYGVSTRNYFYCTCEVVLWTTGLALIAPCALYLYLHASQRKSAEDNTQLLWLLLLVALTCACFVGFCAVSYIPY